MLKTEQENVLNEFLQFHGKEWFLKQLQILYPDIYKCVDKECQSNYEVCLKLQNIRQYYTRYQLEDILEKLLYGVAKVVNNKVLLRPINNIDLPETDLYIHMSVRNDLAVKGLKAKTADINSFEQYDARLYLYPLVKPNDFDDKTQSEKEQIELDSIYDFVYNKSSRIAKRFNELRISDKDYYIYLVRVLHNYTFYKDTAQSKDYAVYVRNGISSKYVSLIGKVSKDGVVSCYVE